MAQTRLIHFDVLKGIAILMVLVGHVLLLSMQKYSSLIVQFIVSVHMPIFIFLSGYFSSGICFDIRELPPPLYPRIRSSNRAKVREILLSLYRFVRGKFLRLFLPLFFIPVLFSWINEGCQFWEHTMVPSWTNHYWFTYSLFQIFVVFGVYKLAVACLGQSGWKEIIWGVFYTGLVILGCFAVKMYYPPLDRALFLNKMIWLFPIFMLGSFVGKFEVLERWFRDERVGAVAFFIYVLLFIYMFGEIRDSDVNWLGYILTISGLIVLYSSVYNAVNRSKDAQQGVVTRVLAYLGRISLPIYLVHYFFLPNMPWMDDFFASLESDMQVLGWDIAISFAGIAIVLVPTLIVIKLIQSNKYLNMLLFGEVIRPQK